MRPLTQETSQVQKTTNLTPIKLKSDIQINKNESPKRMKVSSSYHRETTSDRFKLKEICFVKQNLSKKVIAKFNKDPCQPEYDDNEDLVVAWGREGSPRVLSLPERPETSPKCSYSAASTSSKVPTRGSLKNSSFMSNKVRRPKTSLRRLASANIESTGKVDKVKKRKKLKSKII